MMSSIPRIAIPEPTSTDEAYNQRSLPQYISAVEAAGGIAVPIPLGGSRAELASLLASCSGILLPGSPADVDPARYGQQATNECAPRDEAREAVDELLLQNGFAEAKPILGICYGLQSLNVWRRGTLIQDLPHVEGSSDATVNHQPGREVQRAHPVLLTPGSRLAHVVTQVVEDGDPQLFVNSSHHQAVERPGEGLMVAGISSVDGVIEAVEGVEPNQFVVAVQWHPERSYESSPASRDLFKAFLEATREWSAPKVTLDTLRPGPH